MFRHRNLSAMGIIKAGLEKLSKMRCSYIFTSHLHQLTELPQIKNLRNLKIYHLSIEYDKLSDCLIYNRTLKEGSGPSIYGLKVCEALGMDPDFIKSAKEIVEDPLFIRTNQSHYNSNIYMDQCKLCGSNQCLETHHIKEQQLSNEHKLIGNIHQNQLSNIIQLCKSCHDKITYGTLTINGYVQTTNGYKIDVQENHIHKSNKKRYDEPTILTILKYENTYKTNRKLCKQLLEKNEGITISLSTLHKIMNHTYE